MDIDISSVSVMLFCENTQIGSGCLLWSEDETTLYCITADHCIVDDKDELITDICICNSSFSNKRVKIVIHNPEKDIAVFIVNNEDEFPDIPLSLTYDYQHMDNRKVTLSGFPFKYNKQRTSVSGEIQQNETERIEFTVNSLDPYTDDRFDQVNGISGCGCFILSGSTYKFIGIETGAISKDVPFKNLFCTKFSVINKLIMEHELPPLPNSTPDYITNGKLDKPHIVLEYLNYHFDRKWYPTEIFKAISSRITAFISNPVPDDSTLFIGGLSGSGKTRSVLESVREIKDVIYYECYQDFEYDISIIRKSNERFYIIVDEATLDDFLTISSMFRNQGNKYKIIIIGCTPEKPDYGYDDTKTLFLNKLTRDDTISVLKECYQQFDDDICQTIFELSSNDLRLALLIAKIYTARKTTDISAIPSKYLRDEYTSADQILKKMLDLHVEERPMNIDLEKCFVHLSLFIDIGFQNQDETELHNLVDYFTSSDSSCNQTFASYKCAIDYFEKIQLGIKKGNYFEESPRALAKAAFEQQGCLLVQYSIPELMSSLQSQILREKFIKRVSECGKKEVEEQVSSWFRNKYSAMNIGDSDFSERELMLLSEYYPEIGLPILKNYLFSVLDSEQLVTLLPLSLRRHIIWTCEHLANFSKYFYVCEEIIFRLAQNETEHYFSNNSQGIWCGFFSVYLSNTEEPYLKRFELLLKRASDAAASDSSLFEKAFEVVFNNASSIILPPKIIGNKITPKGWKPSYLDEFLEIKEYQLKEVVRRSSSFCNVIRQTICTALIGALDSFISLGMIIEYQEAVNSFLNNQEQKNTLIINLERKIRTIKHHTPENKELTTFITSWIEQLQQNDFNGRLCAFLTRDIYSYGYTKEDKENKEALISKLAKDIINTPNKNDIICGILSEKQYDGEALLELSEKLALFDEENELFEIIESIPAGVKYNSFVRGYYCGLYQKNDRVLPARAIQLLEKEKIVDADFVLWASISFDVSDTGLKRIIELILSANIIRSLIDLGSKVWIDFTSPEDKRRIISLIFESNNKQKIHIIFQLFEFWLRYESNDSILYKCLFDVLNKCVELCLPFDDYTVEGILENLPLEYQNQAISIFVSLFEFENSSEIYNNSILTYIEAIKTTQNEALIFNTLANRLLVVKHQSFYKAHTGIFDDYSFQIVKDWINQDKTTRAILIAYHLSMPSPNKPDFSPITLYILTEFENIDKVYQRFFLGNSNLKMITPKNIYKNKKSWIDLTDRYKASPHRRIRQWAEDKRNEIESICERFIQSEEYYKRLS